MSRFSRSPQFRKLALHALAVLLVFAQTMVLSHRVAHAAVAGQAQVAAEAPVSDTWNDLFGHGASLTCDDWNAAFGLDTNPGTAAATVAMLADAAPVPASAFESFLPAVRAGPFLARAPPRL